MASIGGIEEEAADDPTKISLKRLIQLVGRVYGRWLATQTTYQAAAATSALAVGTDDGVDHKAIYKMILDKIRTLEHFIRTGKTGLAATKAAQGRARHVPLWLLRWARVRGGGTALHWRCPRRHHSRYETVYPATGRWKTHLIGSEFGMSATELVHSVGLCSVGDDGAASGAPAITRAFGRGLGGRTPMLVALPARSFCAAALRVCWGGYSRAVRVLTSAMTRLPGAPRPDAIPPFRYWQPEGYYWSLHTRGWAWHPGSSHPPVVIPGFAGFASPSWCTGICGQS
ncbi:hypothetical protein CYMTET_40533 [Cymbomonas tetramitiformis]|uniref:Uncharacterized protein n=1 Tax=Cymbomonas tetramitiformis TaxID=36881 RepID=A0AAE0F2W1_9CHLO|nr:hypothetical protein CYMTET_40533 [Cymbomonas tetramitiformis]